MEKEESLTTATVYSSLLNKPRTFGIGQMPFFIIVMFTTLLVSLVHPLCFVIGIVTLLTCKQICRKEEYLLDFLIENLSQSDVYMG